MSNLFQRLSTNAVVGRDGLTQPQREAIVDLLFYCMAADRNASLRADRLISNAVDKMNWEPKAAYKAFSERSFTNGRELAALPNGRMHFLNGIARRLDSAEAKRRALEVCQNLFQVDATASPPENELYAEIATRLA